MIDGADKLLMEHRNRQVMWAAERIAALEAEVASLRSAQLRQPAICPLSDAACEWWVVRGSCAFVGSCEHGEVNKQQAGG